MPPGTVRAPEGVPLGQESASGDHRCARAGRCLGAQVDVESGRRFGAPTSTPDTLCDACARAVTRAVEALPRDYVDLEMILDVHARRGEYVSGSPELPVPPRLDVMVAQAAIDAELSCWVEPVAEQLGVQWDTQLMAMTRPGVRLSRAAHLLALHTPLLLALGPVDVVGWNHGPVLTTKTGVEAGLILLELHRRARLLATGGSGDVRLPVPCPSCEGALIRPNGLGHVQCRGCARSWPESDYHRLCLVLAQDYRAVAG